MAEFETLRFGKIDVPPEEQIEFRRGLLGYERLRRFVHLEIAGEAPLGWLQSLEEPGTAFVVANPAVFFPNYKIEIDPRELGEVKPGPNDRLLVLGICTVPDDFSDISINLLGPLVINTATHLGKQVVLNRSPYSTQHRLADASDAVGKTKPRRVAPRPRSGSSLAVRAV
jgi:flagellar assembly factor FliW